MFDIRIGYPKPADELEIAKSTTSDVEVEVAKVSTGPEITHLQQVVRKLPVSDHVALYAVNLARSTRPDDEIAPAVTKEFVSWGAGTRAVQYLVLGAKARAAIAGRIQRAVLARPRRRRAGPPAPRPHELPRRGRGDDLRQDRRPVAQGRRTEPYAPEDYA